MKKDRNFEFKLYKSAPIFMGALFFILGAVAAVKMFGFPQGAIFFGPKVPTFAIGVILFILVTSFAVLYGFKKKTVIIAFLLIGVLGFFMAQTKMENGFEKEGIIEHASITGKIAKVIENGENSIALILEDVTLLGEVATQDIKGRVSLIVYGQSASFLEGEYYLPKSIISAQAQLMYPAGSVEYGFMDERLDLLSQKIFYKALSHYAQIEIVKKNKPPFISEFFSSSRQNVFGKLERYVGGEESALLHAVVTGSKNALSADIKDDFSKLGISHLLATSGLHIGILLLAALFFMKKIRTPIIISSSVCVLIILLFMFFAGFRSSMVRASIMWAALMVSKITGSKISPLNALGVAMLFMAIVNPLCIFDISFVLSCASVMAISLFINEISDVGVTKKGKKIMSAAFVSLAVIFFTWPITAYYFNSVSVLSPLYNILFVPLAGVLLFLGVIFSLLSGIGFLAPILGTAAKAISFVMIKSVDFLAGFSPSLKLISPSAFIIFLWMAGTAVVSRQVIKSKPKVKIIAAFTLIACSLAAMIIAQISTQNQSVVKTYSDGTIMFIYMQEGNESALLLNDNSWIARTVLKKSAAKDLDILIYSGNEAETLAEIMKDLNGVNVGAVYAAKSVADEFNLEFDEKAEAMYKVGFMEYDIELLEFKAKSKTAKIHYAALLTGENSTLLYLDPISLREGAFTDRYFNEVVSSRWSKSRTENILNIDFGSLYYSSNSTEHYSSTLQLEQLGTTTYNVTEGTKILFTKEGK